MTHWFRATRQEAPAAGIWLPGGVEVGSGVSQVENSLCDQPSDRVREPPATRRLQGPEV
jgi:hypothetical protein